MKRIAFFLSIFVSSVFLQAYGADGQSARSEAAQAQAGRAAIAQDAERRTDRQGRLSPEARAAIESGDLARMQALVSEDDRGDLPDVQGFQCLGNACECTTLDDCMDLFETGICRGSLECGSYSGDCVCERLVRPIPDNNFTESQRSASIRAASPEIRAALVAGDYERAISLLNRNQNIRGPLAVQTTGQTPVRQARQQQSAQNDPRLPPEVQPFACGRNTCDCSGVYDCIDLARSGLCADRLTCGEDECICYRARAMTPSNPSTSSTTLRDADRR
ncbi:MAG: hypothetical protein KIS81_01925 [Maricaulaceae bacterium]|nr:hypothetical protein [Maricaulaceae bacterium]